MIYMLGESQVREEEGGKEEEKQRERPMFLIRGQGRSPMNLITKQGPQGNGRMILGTEASGAKARGEASL